MLSRTYVVAVVFVGALAAAAALAQAQDEHRAKPGFSSMIDVNALVDNHVRFLARKYDLTEEQEAFTLQFLQQKADQFLAQHRDELFAVADRLFEVRGGAEISQQELIEWGKRAQPLYEEAKTLIIEGNDQWREILTDKQRAIHDEDVRMMLESFTETEDQLNRIVSGQMTVEEFRRGPRPAKTGRTTTAARPTHRSTPTPAVGGAETGTPNAPGARPVPGHTPPAGGGAGVAGPTRGGAKGDARSDAIVRDRLTRLQTQAGQKGMEFESEWERYVRDFIARYQLDEGQTQRANTILKDCQEQARSYMKRRAATLEQLDEKAKAAAGSKDKAAELKEINDQRQKIMEPLTRIFEQRLKPRLDKLPTRAQREAAEKNKGTPTARPPVRQPIQPAEPPPPPPEPEPEPEPEEQPAPDQGSD